MDACSHCKELNLEAEIVSPKDFAKALRIAKANIADGTIQESSYWPPGVIRSCKTPFSQIRTDGAWQEDIFEYYFECTKCHKLYHLSCNTYHGSGGAWRPVNESEI